MKRFGLFAAGLGVLVVVWQPGAAQGQAGKTSGLRLSLVGIAVSDYAKSQAFYERVMGFPVAFKFSSQDGTRTNTFFQMSRDTFLEMQQATADAPPGLTHAHFVVDDLNTTLARLRQAGVPPAPRTGRPANAVTEAGYSQNIFVKNANVFDPNGIRLELNELVPESLMKKAAESWTAAQDAKGLTLNVVGIATITRLRQAGLAAAAGNAPGTMSSAVTVSPGARVRNVNVFDPDGIRLELNEYSPESLPQKAVDAWQ